MRFTGLFATVAALLLGVTAAASAQEPHVVYDRERGELSKGTDIPSQEALEQAIRSGSPTRLMGMLEYGERLECYRCVPLLVDRMLASDNARLREFSAWWLRRRTFVIGSVATKMRDILENGDDATRRARAAEALGEFLTPSALPPLRAAAMRDAAPKVRTAAVRALGRLNHPDGSSVIAAAMEDAEAEVRKAALSQVLEVNFFRDHGAIIGRLGDDDRDARRKAAQLAGELRIGDAVPALAGLLLDDPSGEVRKAAAWALGRIQSAGGVTSAQRGEARGALNEAEGVESDSLVRDAIRIGLAMRR